MAGFAENVLVVVIEWPANSVIKRRDVIDRACIPILARAFQIGTGYKKSSIAE